MKFRLKQVGRHKRTKGWNLMFGKTFIRSFHWNEWGPAKDCLEKMNEALADVDSSCHFSKYLIQKTNRLKPPKDNYLG